MMPSRHRPGCTADADTYDHRCALCMWLADRELLLAEAVVNVLDAVFDAIRDAQIEANGSKYVHARSLREMVVELYPRLTRRVSSVSDVVPETGRKDGA